MDEESKIDNTMNYFAEQLKLLRTKHGLTMQNLADNARVSKSTISMIEQGSTRPTIDVAARLANALRKPLSEMLHPHQSTRTILIPHNEQAVWEDAQHITRRNISPIFSGLKLEWLQVELPPGSVIDVLPIYAPGTEKCILVINGIFEITIRDKVYRLKKGDSIYFEPDCPHAFRNPGNSTGKYYIVTKHG